MICDSVNRTGLGGRQILYLKFGQYGKANLFILIKELSICDSVIGTGLGAANFMPKFKSIWCGENNSFNGKQFNDL